MRGKYFTFAWGMGFTFGFLMAAAVFFSMKHFFHDKESNSLKHALKEATQLINLNHGLNQEKSTKVLNRNRLPVDCTRLFEANEDEQRKAQTYQDTNPKKTIPDNEYIQMASDCDKFIAERNYYTSPPFDDEKDFPLAFDLLVFKDVEHFERLLRAVYRPQNKYCVHVDKKANASVHEAIDAITACLENVFVLRNNIDVEWGTYSVMEPDILCLQALMKYKKWKYFISLTGQEFPLKTNWELVQILKALNGSNIIGATVIHVNPERLAGRPPPPINVTPIKGPVHIAARREFVEYAVNTVDGQKLLNWTKLVGHSSEYFFSTLNHNPQLKIPGSYLGHPESDDIIYPFLARYKIWVGEAPGCRGIYIRTICIFGVGDLPWLSASKAFFANKFHLNYQPLALDCIEELIFNRTQNELLGTRRFNTSYYKGLAVTWNHI